MENDKCRCECKNPKEHQVRKKDYIWNLATSSCQNGECLASSIDDSVTTSEQIVNAADSVSTSVTNIRNTISRNVTSTMSINSDDKKASYKIRCYIFHAVLLLIILLLIIAIICYHYAKHKSKLKNVLPC